MGGASNVGERGVKMTEPADEPAGGNRRSIAGEPLDLGRAPAGVVDAHTRERLFRLAYRFVWNRADAEDAVQSAIAAAWEEAGRLRQHDRWWSWLCSIVVQRCRLARRKSGRWRQWIEGYGRNARQATSATNPHAGELAESVRELLPRLPRRQYEVVVLRHLQGMDYEEIAEVLGISASTARVHARDGLEALRKLVLREAPELMRGTS